MNHFEQESTWQQELQRNITSVDELAGLLPMNQDEIHSLKSVEAHHPMNITRYYLSLIDKNYPQDPIRKMAVPSEEELVIVGDMGATTGDPYGDDKHNKGNGILHKYPYSALIVATEYCSMYCRHCFRKRLVGLSTDKTVENFKKAASYVAEHPEISNVVISGGDPLLLPTHVLKEVLESLVDIPHLNFVRIGSRAPVVFPQRFDDPELLELFKRTNQKKALYLPTHFNHPKELTSQAKKALLAIRNCGVTVNNQAVLLKGVNDDEETLYQLMTQLTASGVNPYYLYQCMPVSRVRHHFQVPLKRGIEMVARVKARLDGYAKRFKFIMGHEIGKIEICGLHGDTLVLSQIHAPKEEADQASRILFRKINDEGGWLEDFEEL